MRRVSASSLLKRLDALDGEQDGEPRRPGVMRIPPIMSIDAWEALAVPMQAAAFEAAREDTLLRGQRGVVTPTQAEEQVVRRYGYVKETGEPRVIETRMPLPPNIR